MGIRIGLAAILGPSLIKDGQSKKICGLLQDVRERLPSEAVNDVFVCGGRPNNCRQDDGQDAENGFQEKVPADPRLVPQAQCSPTEWSEPEIIDSKLSLRQQIAITEQEVRLLRRLAITQNLVLVLLVGAIALLLT